MQMLGLGRGARKFSKSSWRGTRVIYGHEVIGVLGHEAGATIYAAREAGSSKVCALKHVVVRAMENLWGRSGSAGLVPVLVPSPSGRGLG